MRAVFEVMGVTDIVAKSHGSTNPYNMVRATLDALKRIDHAGRDRRQARPDGRRDLQLNRRGEAIMADKKTLTVKLVRSIAGTRDRIAPRCAAWACASSTASRRSKTRPRCAA